MCFSSDHQPQASPPPREARDARCMRQCEVRHEACLICARTSGTLTVSAAGDTGHTAVRAEALHSVRIGDEDQLEAIPRCPGCCHVHVPAAGPRPRTHRCKRALTTPRIWTAAHIAAASRPQRRRSQRPRLRFGLGHGAAEPNHRNCGESIVADKGEISLRNNFPPSRQVSDEQAWRR